MKLYMLFVDKVEECTHTIQKAEPHISKESAIKAFKKLVEQERPKADELGWYPCRDEEDCFEAYNEDSYVADHINVCIMEEDLQNLCGSDVVTRLTYGAYENEHFYGKCQLVHTSISNWNHEKYENVECPVGKKLHINFKYESNNYDVEIDMQNFVLDSHGDESKSASISTNDEADCDKCFEVTVYTDKENKVYHVECFHYGYYDDDDVEDEKIKLTLKRGEDDYNYFEVIE